jgi:hypothetical protein
MVTMDRWEVLAEWFKGRIKFFSEWLEDTPLEMPDVECLEALLRVENPLWQDWRLVMEPL